MDVVGASLDALQWTGGLLRLDMRHVSRFWPAQRVRFAPWRLALSLYFRSYDWSMRTHTLSHHSGQEGYSLVAGVSLTPLPPSLSA